MIPTGFIVVTHLASMHIIIIERGSVTYRRQIPGRRALLHGRRPADAPDIDPDPTRTAEGGLN